jgi:RNA polymerase sigma factor (TIGR02999 family)
MDGSLGGRGDAGESPDASFSALYPELRSLAHARLRAGRDTLLDTTSLVHEFYIRVFQSGKVRIEDWSRFLHYASRSMRSIIVDSIRRRRAERHGGRAVRVDLTDDAPNVRQSGEEEILTIHQALQQLEAIDQRLALVVEMRYFGGMTDTEIADALGVTERTVRRDWQKARLLLAQSLG